MSYSLELSELVDDIRELKQKKRDLQLVANMTIFRRKAYNKAKWLKEVKFKGERQRAKNNKQMLYDGLTRMDRL